MDEKLLEELISSIREAGAIKRGKRKASRSIKFADVDVQAVRAKTGLSQSQFAALLGIRHVNA